MDFLYPHMLEAEPEEFRVICDALLPHKEVLIGRLWPLVEKVVEGEESQRLRAASALAIYDPHSPRWMRIEGTFNNDFANLRATKVQEKEWSIAREMLAFAPDHPGVLTELLLDADEKLF